MEMVLGEKGCYEIIRSWGEIFRNFIKARCGCRYYCDFILR